MNDSTLNDGGTLPNWLDHAHRWAFLVPSPLHFAELHKPLAVHVGATIVVLTGLWGLLPSRRRA